MIDSDLLFNNDMRCDEKNKVVMEKLTHSFSKYPEKNCSDSVSIIHITRDTEVIGYPDFFCYKMVWTKTSGWKVENLILPKTSDILITMGSGGREFTANYNRYRQGPNNGTSRNVFHCFIDTLHNIKDEYCGGPPQMVGIYRKPNSSAKNYGIIHQGKRYFLGAEVPNASYFSMIEWRNEFFELCDGGNKRILEIAVKQPDSLRRK